MGKLECGYIDSNITKNFTFKEAFFSDYALRNNIINVPISGNGSDDLEIFNNIQHTTETILQKCRDNFGIPFSPSSFYRCQEVNEGIGGSKNSQHMKGEAVDFIIPSIDNYTLFHYIKDNIEFDQLILEYKSWIHCSVKRNSSENRRKAFYIN